MKNPEEIAKRLGLTLSDFELMRSMAPTIATTLISAAIKPFETSDEFDHPIDIADIAGRVVRDIMTTGNQFQDNLKKWMPNKNSTVISGISTWTINNSKEDF